MVAAELRGGNKPSLNEALGWIGSRVDDIYGANVGRLEDVWIDPGTGVPRWLLVKEGRFSGRTTLIPFEDATAGAGHVWVPYEGEVVREAPEIEPGAPLSHQVEASLRSHYAANAPAANAQRGHGRQSDQPAPSLNRSQQGPMQSGSATGTATVRLQGGLEVTPSSSSEEPPLHRVRSPSGPQAGPSQQPRPAPPPQRGPVLREQPAPAGTIPPPQLPTRPAPPIAPRQEYPPQANPPSPEHGQYAQSPQPPQQPQPPPQPTQWQGYPPWQAPLPPQPSPQRQPAPIEALQSIANSPEVHYVEIELSGELSIRGELRSVRVVPRQPRD